MIKTGGIEVIGGRRAGMRKLGTNIYLKCCLNVRALQGSTSHCASVDGELSGCTHHILQNIHCTDS